MARKKRTNNDLQNMKCKIEQQELRGISYLPESIMMKFVVASQGSQGSQSQRIREYNLCSSIYPYLQLKINMINLSVLLLFPIV